MRIRGTSVALLGVLGAASITLVLAPAGTGAAWGAVKFLAGCLGIVSGACLLIRGARVLRDRIFGIRRSGTHEMFPAGRCHACGYDTSTLVRGIVACPECGAVLASIPGTAIPGATDLQAAGRRRPDA